MLRWRKYGSPLSGPAFRGVPSPPRDGGCSVSGCDKEHYGHGFCSAHYTRRYRGKNLHAVSDRQRVAAIPDSEILRLYAVEQWSTIKISKHFGIADVTVSAILKRNNVEIRPDYLTRPRPDSRTARSKLNEPLIVATYRAVDDIGVMELARFHNADKTTIKTILLENGVSLRPITKVRHGGKWKSGPLHPGYNPALTDEDRVRQRPKALSDPWRLAVFIRDRFECQSCGALSRKIEAHHVESYASNPQLRWEIGNGITFCRDCHIAFHKRFGKKNNTRSQLAEFIAPGMVELAA